MPQAGPTLREIHREVRRLRSEIQALRQLLVPEVEPTAEEWRAIREGRREFRRGAYVGWETIRREFRK